MIQSLFPQFVILMLLYYAVLIGIARLQTKNHA